MPAAVYDSEHHDPQALVLRSSRRTNLGCAVYVDLDDVIDYALVKLVQEFGMGV